MRNELLKGLTKEQIKKIEACKNPKEILALAKAEGVKLSDEQLEAVSGGCGIKDPYDYVVDQTMDQVCPDAVKTPCPYCGSYNFTQSYDTHKKNITSSTINCKCNDCGGTWSVNLA